MTVKVKTEFHEKRLRRAAKLGSFKSLKHAGFGLRQTARRMIKKSKTASAPGTPPHTRGRPGGLKRVMAVAVVSINEVDIGPESTTGKTIWGLHEFGGSSKRTSKKYKRPKIGSKAPLTYEGFTAGKPVLIRTAAQQARANAIAEQREQNAHAARNYPPRPFMAPALVWDLPRIPENWKGSVQRI